MLSEECRNDLKNYKNTLENYLKIIKGIDDEIFEWKNETEMGEGNEKKNERIRREFTPNEMMELKKSVLNLKTACSQVSMTYKGTPPAEDSKPFLDISITALDGFVKLLINSMETIYSCFIRIELKKIVKKGKREEGRGKR